MLYIGVTTERATKPTTRATPEHEHGLEDRDHLLGLVLELLIEEVGGLVEVAVERTGLLADLDHLDEQRPEEPGCRQAARDPFAGEQPLADRAQALT